MIKARFDRLLEMAHIDENYSFQWNNDDKPISTDEIIKCMNAGINENAEPHGDTFKHPVERKRDRQYHIGRILYFINHPQEIAGIEVDNKCGYWGSSASILPECEIVDGWHRIAAAIIVGLRYIDIEYGGRRDIEDYLTEKSNHKPEDDLIF